MHQRILTYYALRDPFRTTVLFNILGIKVLPTAVTVVPSGMVLGQTH